MDEEIRDFFSLNWFIIKMDGSILTSVYNLKERKLDSPSSLINRFYYAKYNGYDPTHYGWVTEFEEFVVFEREKFENYVQKQLLSAELLRTLADKESIELYISMLDM